MACLRVSSHPCDSRRERSMSFHQLCWSLFLSMGEYGWHYTPPPPSYTKEKKKISMWSVAFSMRHARHTQRLMWSRVEAVVFFCRNKYNFTLIFSLRCFSTSIAIPFMLGLANKLPQYTTICSAIIWLGLFVCLFFLCVFMLSLFKKRKLCWRFACLAT